MKADILIKNGRVIDPSRKIDRAATVAVKDRKIQLYQPGMTADTEINAEGCLVTPGLIDFHAHIYDRGTDAGINPDIAMIPHGVTAVVDAGSSGVSSYRSFLERLSRYYIKTRIYLNVSPAGQTTSQFQEPLYPDKWSIENFKTAFDIGQDKILGLKMRASKSIVGDAGLNPFYAAIAMADQIKKSLCVHVSDPPAFQSEIASALRPGDIYCHVFHGMGNTIYEDGHISDAIWEAKKRGVIFDSSHGATNFSFAIAERAIAQGFAPDIISTDLTVRSWCKQPVFGLPHIMSKFLLLGMNESDIITCVTSKPAQAMHMQDEIGTLAPGSCADIAILKVFDKEINFYDAEGQVRRGDKYFAPMMTIMDGTIMFRSHELWH